MKKLAAGILTGALALSMTAGCFAADSTEAAAVDDTEATLNVLNWGSTVEEQIANDAIARFNEQYPNVTVKQTCVPVDQWSDFIQKWISMSTSGEAPDVINVGLEAIQMAVQNDLVYSLDDVVSSDDYLKTLQTEYAESLLKGFTVDGQLYGLPSGTQTMVMYYNKKMFDEAGIEYPKNGWTWDDFYNDAKALTKEDGSVYGYGLSSSYFQLTPWWVTNGASLIDADNNPTVNSDAMVEAVDFLEKLTEEKITPDPISSDVYTMFASKKLAMVGAGRWVLNTWKDAGLTNDDFDCVQWPQKTQAGTVYGGSAWCIGKSTQNKDIAVALLESMVSEETLKANAAGGQQIPPTKALATDPEIMGTTPDGVMEIWAAVEAGSPIAAPTYYGDLQTSFQRGLEEVFSGSMAPKDALDQVQSEVEGLAQ